MNRVARIPLRQWSEGEFNEQNSPPQSQGRGDFICNRVLLRKTAVAYGIAELLRQTRSHCNTALSRTILDEQCNINNFIVRIKAPGQGCQPTWRDIEGVDMLSPRLSMNIVEPSFLLFMNDHERGDYGSDQEENMGGFLEAEFTG